MDGRLYLILAAGKHPHMMNCEKDSQAREAVGQVVFSQEFCSQMLDMLRCRSSRLGRKYQSNSC